jgi:hypothetical protein
MSGVGSISTIGVYLFMPDRKEVTANHRLAKWFINITLVLAFVSFSGHASSSKTLHNQFTTTEVKITDRAHKKTVPYKTFIPVRARLFAEYLTSSQNFIFTLLHYESSVYSKYQWVCEAHTAFKKPFRSLIVYSADNTEAFT